MSDNLSLWHQVEKTPPAHVKAITGKAYSGTSPKPYYLVQKATETFGPCGIGWGFEIVSERVEDGAAGEKLHIARVRVWYEWQGKRGTVEHVGGTPFAGTRASGKPFVDEDAPKKSVTDALVKALSMIGFAGDIFMGRYDDSRYVADLRHEEAEERKQLAATEAASRPAPRAVPRAASAEPAPAAPAAGQISNAAVSSNTRQRLMEAMSKQRTRSELRTWADNPKVAAAIEGMLDKDQTMFSAEFQKRWQALPESVQMAG